MSRTTRGRLDTRDWRGEFDIEFQNSDKFVVELRWHATNSCRGRFRIARA